MEYSDDHPFDSAPFDDLFVLDRSSHHSMSSDEDGKARSAFGADHGDISIRHHRCVRRQRIIYSRDRKIEISPAHNA